MLWIFPHLLCSPYVDQLSLLRLNKLFSPPPPPPKKMCRNPSTLFIAFSYFCALSSQRERAQTGASAFILPSYFLLAGRKIHAVLVRPAALITHGRLCNCVGGSIVLAIGSLLTIIQKRSPTPRRSTMSNKSRGVGRGCGALTATQKRGNLGKRLQRIMNSILTRQFNLRGCQR